VSGAVPQKQAPNPLEAEAIAIPRFSSPPPLFSIIQFLKKQLFRPFVRIQYIVLRV
jgi:hypothetical protein